MMHLHTEHHRFCASFKYFSARLDKACFSVHLSPSPSSSLPLLCTLQSVCLLVRYEVQLLWLRKRISAHLQRPSLRQRFTCEAAFWGANSSSPPYVWAGWIWHHPSLANHNWLHCHICFVLVSLDCCTIHACFTRWPSPVLILPSRLPIAPIYQVVW